MNQYNEIQWQMILLAIQSGFSFKVFKIADVQAVISMSNDCNVTQIMFKTGK